MLESIEAGLTAWLVPGASALLALVAPTPPTALRWGRPDDL
ncbi:hypothetical protein [Marinobacter sp. LV10MA510-1]|nr:hypothetical protein [Marinobacter sp. LV10MA510-1]